MKKLFAMLTLCLLLPAGALAFDLSMYEIESTEGTVADTSVSRIDLSQLDGQPEALISTGGGYICIQEREGEFSRFLLYDRALRLTAQGQLPSERALLCALYDDGDALLLSLLLPMQPKTQFLAARIFKDGQLHWQYMADHDWLHGFSSAVPDGGGGAWLINQVQDDNPYSGMYMTHVNANGETEPVRTLRTGKEILLIHTAVSHPEDNSVTLYCSLVAKSKGVYIALAVTLDSAGNLLDTQARDFSMREDTAFWYFTEPSGKAWVFSQLPNSQSRNMLLVPFDDLPSLPPPALYFQ